MSSINRRILLVDDSSQIKPKIRAYKRIFDSLKTYVDDIKMFDLEIIHIDNIESALKYLSDNPREIFHTMLIDYNFDNDDTGNKGEYLVREIRRKVNKKCKIIFYTMDAITSVDPIHLINLINNDVYRFILKSSSETIRLKYEKLPSYTDEDQYIVEIIIDSIKELDPIAESLESYLIKYGDRLAEFKVKIKDEDIVLSELLKEIRLETDIGNLFVRNLLDTSILNTIRFLGQEKL